MPLPKVTVLTVTYGKRWPFLSQVIETVMKDEHVTNLVIVDNGSQNKDDIESGVKKFGDKVLIIRHEKNLGSAGGFAAGLAAVREIDCDFVFILDDDNVPEEGAIAQFLEIRKFFPDTNVVLVGNRLEMNAKQDFFYHPPIKSDSSEKLMFKSITVRRVYNFLRTRLVKRQTVKQHVVPFTPIIPMIGFAYGGSFLPIDAVRKSPLPDASLVLYGDDSEYSKKISRLGYNVYLCSRPVIHDIDLSFSNDRSEKNKAPSTFDVSTPPFKIYFSIRNMVRISIMYSYRKNPFLFLKIAIWVVALCVLGLFKIGYTPFFRERVVLILRAIHDGYNHKSKPPKEASLP